jgi:acyl-CoA synthetase (NDP forming)
MVYYVDRRCGRSGAVLSAVSEVAGRAEAPVVASIVGADGELPVTQGESVPNYRFPESCAGVLGRAAERREWLSRPVGEQLHFEHEDRSADAVITSCLERGGVWLGLREGEALLSGYGIASEPAVECESAPEAVAAARAIDGPVALKAKLPPPRTPSDLDAVLLGLEGEAAIESGWRELQRRVELAGQGWGGAVVQRLAPPGADVLVGAVSDPDLGPVMALGLGGRQAGLAASTAFRLLPATDVEADELIDGSEAVVAQLGGFRGRPRLDRDALRELILRFAALLRDQPEAAEVDLNPVRLMARGYVVLEMRLRAERRRPQQRVKTW